MDVQQFTRIIVCFKLLDDCIVCHEGFSFYEKKGLIYAEVILVGQGENIFLSTKSWDIRIVKGNPSKVE
jgi:hypothetical protein